MRVHIAWLLLPCVHALCGAQCRKRASPTFQGHNLYDSSRRLVPLGKSLASSAHMFPRSDFQLIQASLSWGAPGAGSQRNDRRCVYGCQESTFMSIYEIHVLALHFCAQVGGEDERLLLWPRSRSHESNNITQAGDEGLCAWPHLERGCFIWKHIRRF